MAATCGRSPSPVRAPASVCASPLVSADNLLLYSVRRLVCLKTLISMLYSWRDPCSSLGLAERGCPHAGPNYRSHHIRSGRNRFRLFAAPIPSRFFALGRFGRTSHRRLHHSLRTPSGTNQPETVDRRSFWIGARYYRRVFHVPGAALGASRWPRRLPVDPVYPGLPAPLDDLRRPDRRRQEGRPAQPFRPGRNLRRREIL